MSDLFERISKLSPKRLALLAIDLQAKLDAAEQGRNEPVAIVGMACRFPGASSPEAYWDLLHNGVDAIREIPPSRWDVDAYYDPDPDAPGKLATRWGGFLDQIDHFDPQMFGIAPREAASMDPQQRLLLEVGWEAIERAGYAPDSLHGSSTGVFVGLCNADYGQLLMDGDDQHFDMYLSTGNAASVASGRLSYVFGFQGPAISVDTACSSSLVALHLAIQSLRDGACRMALAGGVNVILSPKTTMTLSRARMMASDGRCKAFDARADGFVRAEGCGLVVLKRLTDARADGDTILAVIRGSAINQDGRSNGLTAPNGPSQVAVIRAALADAQVAPAELSYVETHGTGTSLGDPIEAQALGAALGVGRPPEQPLIIGSVKTNIGHLESAAGIAGLIKVVLMLQHAEIPPHLHLTRPSPYIAWDELPLALPTNITPWSTANGRRLAGVSSFGFSGTNAHIILESAPPALAPAIADIERPLHLLKLAARSAVALRELADRYAHYLAANPCASLADIAYSAAIGRSELNHRCAIIAETPEQAQAALAAYAANTTHESIVSGMLHNQRQPDVVFLFTGHGSHYVNMGRQLYQTQPVFRAALNHCAEVLLPLVDRPLLELLFDDTGSRALEKMAYSQPALFAIEYALATLWQSWGVRPVAVAGHSAGEYVAAVIAGVFSLEDGLKLIAARGRLMGSLPADGAMAAVLASEERVARAIAPYNGQISIAAINGPHSVALSGNASALQSLLEKLRADGIEVRPLSIPIAAHSPQVDPILDAFERVAKEVRYNPPQIEVISGMTGQLAQGDDLVNASYWRHHLRQAVRFADAMRTLYDQGRRIFVEIGPHPTLLNMGRHILPEHECAWLPSLRSVHDEWQQMLQSAGALYTNGINLDWASFDAPYPRRRVVLPTYPFQRERHWMTASQRRPGRTLAKGEHPLLGRRLRSPHLRDSVFETQLGAHYPAFLDHHRIYGSALLPSPVYLEMARAAAQSALGGGLFAIQDFSIREALILPENGERDVQLIMAADGQEASFEILSHDRQLDQWALHANGRLLPATNVPSATTLFQPAVVQVRCEQHIAGADYYERLYAHGLEFGSSFRGLTDIWRRDGEALGRVVLPEAIATEAPAYGIHPAMLDACFHLLGAPLSASIEQTSYLLIAIERFQIYARPGGQLWNHTVLRPGYEKAGETFTGDIRLYNDDGYLVAEALGLHLKLAGREALLRATRQLTNDWLYEVQWQPKAIANTQTLALSLAPDVVADLSNRVPALAAQHGLAAYRELLPALDTLSLAYIVEALHTLGWVPRPTERVNAAHLAAQLGVIPGHERLFGRMLAILAEEGWLKRSGQDWLVAEPTSVGDASAIAADLHMRFPKSAAEITLAERCGSRLADVLRGTTDPLHLLFPSGSQETAEQIYRDAPFARIANQLVADVVAAAAADLTTGRSLRILEIGGGTGATTAAVLPVLPAGRAEYCFTDISPLFTARAAERFAIQPGLRCQVLDIERDPATQGFEAGQFDIIIAANVLHATSNLRHALDHTRRLLAPHGLLLLVEGTRQSRWTDITFGLTEGWWRFSDSDLRTDYPLLERTRWIELLTSVGLCDAATIPAPAEADIAGQAIMLARAPLATGVLATADNWLILADGGGIGQQLSDLLGQRGITATLIASGDSAVVAANYQRIIDLRGLDAPLPNATLSASELQDAVARTTGATLSLVQKLVATGAAGELWIVTRGAQAVGNLPAVPSQAPLWGLGRVIALEHPELWGGLIDLDSAGTLADDAAALLAELLHSDGEDQIALRDHQRLVARLARRGLPVARATQWQPDASYLITGGLGGLGLKLAHWMAESGARTIVLTSRRGLPAREQWDRLAPASRETDQVAAIRAIEALGARVQIVAADVSDRTAMQALFDRFGRDLPPLRGIVHAATALSNWSIATLPQEALHDMLAPKVAGTWLLHELSRELPLDFFVLFSSTTALWGSRELAHYAAANQFLDALAHYRRAQGLPALSINWGTWDEMRVASDAERRTVASFGLSPLPSDQALELFGSLLTSADTAQIAIAAVDWSLLKPAYETRRQRPFLELMATRSVTRQVGATVEQPALLGQIDGLPVGERRDRIVAFLRGEVARALGIKSAQSIDTGTGLFEMGMDSLMSVELKARIETAVGKSLPSTLTFNYPTIDALTGFLDGSVLPVAAQAVPVQVVQARASSPVIGDDMSEDDLAVLLAAKLARRR